MQLMFHFGHASRRRAPDTPLRFLRSTSAAVPSKELLTMPAYAAATTVTAEATITHAGDLQQTDGVHHVWVTVSLPSMHGHRPFTARLLLEGDQAVVVSRLPNRGVGTILVVGGNWWPARGSEPWDAHIAQSFVRVSLRDPSWDGAGTQGPLPWE